MPSGECTIGLMLYNRWTQKSQFEHALLPDSSLSSLFPRSLETVYNISPVARDVLGRVYFNIWDLPIGGFPQSSDLFLTLHSAIPGRFQHFVLASVLPYVGRGEVETVLIVPGGSQHG